MTPDEYQKWLQDNLEESKRRGRMFRIDPKTWRLDLHFDLRHKGEEPALRYVGTKTTGWSGAMMIFRCGYCTKVRKFNRGQVLMSSTAPPTYPLRFGPTLHYFAGDPLYDGDEPEWLEPPVV